MGILEAVNGENSGGSCPQATESSTFADIIEAYGRVLALIQDRVVIQDEVWEFGVRDELHVMSKPLAKEINLSQQFTWCLYTFQMYYFLQSLQNHNLRS